jgi:uncharacterized protein (TIGR03000 family)
MFYRGLPLTFVALALALLFSGGAWADNPTEKADVHQGKFVRVTGNELAMTGKDGKEHTHTIASDTEFICDGKACKAQDLKAGMTIKVTTRINDPDAVVKVEAIQNSNEEPKARVAQEDQRRNDDPRDRTERRDQRRNNDEAPRDRTERTYQGRHEEPRDQADRENGTRQQNHDEATIAVNLPEGALLTFDDTATVSTGSNRLFVTPALERGRDFHYTIKATLTRDGKTETTSKQITVRAGEQTRVDLRFAQDARYGRLAGDGDSDQGAFHEGKIIRTTDDQLTMGDKEGTNKHTHAITRDTKITLDGKDSKPENLKPGMEVRVTTKEGDKETATRIEAKSAE